MQRSRTSFLALGLVLFWLASPSPLRAAEIEGVRFVERAEAYGENLRLHAVGLLRYRLIFKAYVAALYLADGAEPSEVFDPKVSRRLELEYFWAIDGNDFGRAANAFLERNVERQQLERLRPEIERFHALFRDVEPGDRYSLTYVPGRGTELALNGMPLGIAPGPEFASAYFRIWLGDDPIDASLRRQLLAKR